MKREEDMDKYTELAKKTIDLIVSHNDTYVPSDDELTDEMKTGRAGAFLSIHENGQLRGLITIKDIEKAVQYPNSARDSKGSLLCGAAIGVTEVSSVFSIVVSEESGIVSVVSKDFPLKRFIDARRVSMPSLAKGRFPKVG